MLFQSRHDGNLLYHNPLYIFETRQMTRPHIGKHRNIRLGYPRQSCYLTRGIAAHLRHHKIIIVLHSQQRNRNTYLIIEILRRPVAFAVLAQYMIDHLPRSGLAVAARHPDYRHPMPQTPPVKTRQTSQRCQCILHLQRPHSLVLHFRRQRHIPVNHQTPCSPRHSLRQKIMAVKSLPAQGNKQISFLHLARIGCHSGD
ncbi:MAG: hypothetical protein BWY71_02076 [Planctomycetes bacterium ADurb.Bin412]|nr:MAG: hypothetical protein BWY71_02076 [Planctomycetes bacterium ADurb.Bin412]